VRFSLDWLGDFIDVGAAGGAEKISEALNLAGIEIGAVEPFGEDIVLDADITPNRPDAMNHRGLAREVAAARSLPLRDVSRRYSDPESSGQDVSSVARVTIEVPERCHRFAARLIRGTRAAASLPRLVRRLSAIGLHPINVLVDATNAALWDVGQPLHAFDYDRVSGHRLIVRQARSGERLTTLDGVERTLDPEDVVVADERGALSLAGVIGGVESAISETSRNVLLEAAWWDPVAIRRTARRHGLHTDASHRFERGADIEAIPLALAFAARRILEAGGGTLCPGTIDQYPLPFAARTVRLRVARLRGLSGVPTLDGAAASAILSRLGFTVDRRGEEILAHVPSWRPDIVLEEDLIEEVVRIFGYDRVPSLLPPAGASGPRYSDATEEELSPREVEMRAAEAARQAGLSEAIDFPFSPGEPWEEKFDNLLEVSPFASRPLRVANPLDQTRDALRRLLLPGLLESASRNAGVGSRSTALYETGRVWDRCGDAPDGSPGDSPAYESRHLAFVLAGEAPQFWDRPPRIFDYFDGRRVVERILAEFCGGPEMSFAPLACDAFVSGAGASVTDARGRRVGAFGVLSDAARALAHLSAGIVAGEIDLGALSPQRAKPRFAPFSPYPPVDVDLTLAHAADLPWAALAGEIREARLPNLESFGYRVRYTGSGVPEGVAHSTVSLRFRSAERTLSQEEVNRERDRLVAALEQKFGVKI
jgi:phenylalanyl-tRNA synthetase beta chain